MLRFVFAALLAAALIACPTAMAQTAGCTPPADAATASSPGDDSGTPPATPGDDSTSGGATASAPDDGSGGSGGSGAPTTTLASSDAGDRPAVMLADSGGSGDGVRAQAAQPEPEQPGQEQPGTGEPGEEQPGTGTPGAEQPATGGGGLPRTGLDALRLLVIGVILLLVGARLRVLTRIREIPRRIAARRARTDVALREAVENLRQPSPGSDWAFPDPEAPAPTGVLPSTPVARRTARTAGGDPSPAG